MGSPILCDRHTLLEDKVSSILRFRLNITLWPLLGSICFIALIVNIALFNQDRSVNYPTHLSYADHASWLQLPDRIEKFEKPGDFRIVALVFYTHKDRASILDCYLKRNLVHSGGFLDGVTFVQRSTVAADISYLHTLVDQTPGYTISNNTSDRPWDVCLPGTMYIKIDSEVVYMEDSTIPTLIRTKLQIPHSFLVSANTINEPSQTDIHHHLGVVTPYLPELKPANDPNPKLKSNWRASSLPTWEGPEDFAVPTTFKPPFPSHRWLPAVHLNNTDGTPISSPATNQDRSSWTVGAQQHYSFLEHLEKGELWRYKFPIWDFHYARMGISVMAVWGDDIVTVRDSMNADAVGYLTVDVTKRLGRHAILDGRGLAVRFADKAQMGGMMGTDLLNRYRAYAEENICMT